ncbi:MAG: glycine cleavage system protein GcvH [Bacilli bacterium]|nr:glycine cleavage system protein GcvH [Bacilli bacterium]MBN2877126.1 glycine cleavage system protein GcvH [Bacilli bacterium]
MSKVLKGLLYSNDHEWVKKLNDEEVLVGITDFAAKELGSVVFVDLPEVGDAVEANTEFGAVESVKAASDLVSPVSGEVLEINEDLVGEPEQVNEDAFAAWMIKVKLSNKEELENLLSAEEYEAIL